MRRTNTYALAAALLLTGAAPATAAVRVGYVPPFQYSGFARTNDPRADLNSGIDWGFAATATARDGPLTRIDAMEGKAWGCADTGEGQEYDTVFFRNVPVGPGGAFRAVKQWGGGARWEFDAREAVTSTNRVRHARRHLVGTYTVVKPRPGGGTCRDVERFDLIRSPGFRLRVFDVSLRPRTFASRGGSALLRMRVDDEARVDAGMNPLFTPKGAKPPPGQPPGLPPGASYPYTRGCQTTDMGIRSVLWAKGRHAIRFTGSKRFRRTKACKSGWFRLFPGRYRLWYTAADALDQRRHGSFVVRVTG